MKSKIYKKHRQVIMSQKQIPSTEILDVYINEIQDIADFLDLPIFWLLTLVPTALDKIGHNYDVQDVKCDLAAHTANPGCLTRGGHSCDGFRNQSIYTDFKKMHDKYRKGDYSDFESQARQIITRNDEYFEYVKPLVNCLQQFREQIVYQAGFNPKLFDYACTDKRNYLNEKNKPKCELCTTATSEFGRFCVEHPEMRLTYQQIITEITRISEENRNHQRHEYTELLKMCNNIRLWYAGPHGISARRTKNY